MICFKTLILDLFTFGIYSGYTNIQKLEQQQKVLENRIFLFKTFTHKFRG